MKIATYRNHDVCSFLHREPWLSHHELNRLPGGSRRRYAIRNSTSRLCRSQTGAFVLFGWAEGARELVPEAELAVALQHPQVATVLADRVGEALPIRRKAEANAGVKVGRGCGLFV